MPKISWEIPGLKTVSEANSREHWHKRGVRHHNQALMIALSWMEHINYKIPLPCTITLTRLSPRKLDSHDNLIMCFKWISDEIAARIFPEKITHGVTRTGRTYLMKGHCDNTDQITWKYAQEKSKIQGVRIEIEY